MLEAYGTGTGVAIGAAAVTLPAALVFGAFFAANGKEAEAWFVKSLVVGEVLGLAAALALAHYATPSVSRGILYGLAAPVGLYAVMLGNDALSNHFPGYAKVMGNAL